MKLPQGVCNRHAVLYVIRAEVGKQSITFRKYLQTESFEKFFACFSVRSVKSSEFV